MSEKIYPVSAEWAQRAWVDQAKYKAMYAAVGRRPRRVLGRARQAHRLDQAVHQGEEHQLRARRGLDQMVRGRRHQRSPTTASTATSPSAATRSRSSGKATTPTTPSRSPIASSHARSCRFANVLKAHGVKKGDRVTIYLPMIPEAAYAMLACARHRRDPLRRLRRLLAGQPGEPHRGLPPRRWSITADEGLRGGRKVPLKANVDAAVDKASTSSRPCSS